MSYEHIPESSFQPRLGTCSSGHYLVTHHCAISRGFCRTESPREWDFHLRKAITLPGSLSGTALFSDPAATVCRRRAVLAAPHTMMWCLEGEFSSKLHHTVECLCRSIRTQAAAATDTTELGKKNPGGCRQTWTVMACRRREYR